MEKKIFRVHLYSTDWVTIYDDFIVRAENESVAEDSFDLVNWGSDYTYLIDCEYDEDTEEERDMIDYFFETLNIRVTEVTVEELLEEGWTLEEIEKIEEV